MNNCTSTNWIIKFSETQNLPRLNQEKIENLHPNKLKIKIKNSPAGMVQWVSTIP